MFAACHAGLLDWVGAGGSSMCGGRLRMGNEVSMVYIDSKGEDLPEMGRGMPHLCQIPSCVVTIDILEDLVEVCLAGIRAGRARGDPCVQLGIRKWED